jgi:hypothetical protein
VGAAVVSGGDHAPVLEPGDHALDQIALLVDLGAICDRHLAVLAPGNAGRNVQIGQGLAEPVTPRRPCRRSGRRRPAAFAGPSRHRDSY